MDWSRANWYFRQGIDTFRYEGLHIVLWRTLRLCVSPLAELGMVSFFRKDLTEPLEVAQAKVDLTYGQATLVDIDQLVALVASRHGPRSRHWFKTRSIQDTISDRFGQGSRCFVGRIGTEIVNYNWIFFRRIEYPHAGYSACLSSREALLDDAFTVEEWRGQKIHGAVHSRMLRFLQESGFRTAYTIVNTDGISAGKAVKGLGWDFLGTLLYLTPYKSDRSFAWQVRGTLGPFVLSGRPRPDRQTSK